MLSQPVITGIIEVSMKRLLFVILLVGLFSAGCRERGPQDPNKTQQNRHYDDDGIDYKPWLPAPLSFT